MAKKKNTLKDLDAFLKQEAKSFVQPDTVKKEAQPEAPKPISEQPAPQAIAIDDNSVIDFLASKESTEDLYKIIQNAIEKSGKTCAENKMLINTLLYIKDKDNWKENIKTYWS
uniref:hypothetical protein n=1 Tax=Fulvivirga sp. TaxID=1931237 RepID=UPI00404A6717